MVEKESRTSNWLRIAMSVWIVAFSILVGYEVTTTRNTTATVGQLQHTNCVLRQFLTTAEIARIKTAISDSTEQERSKDIQAAVGYQKLASSFGAVGSRCKIPTVPSLPN